MKREERLEKQKLCDEFINKIEQQFLDFKEQHGIEFIILSKDDYFNHLKFPMIPKEFTERIFTTRNNGLELYYAPLKDYFYINNPDYDSRI